MRVFGMHLTSLRVFGMRLASLRVFGIFACVWYAFGIFACVWHRSALGPPLQGDCLFLGLHLFEQVFGDPPALILSIFGFSVLYLASVSCVWG